MADFPRNIKLSQDVKERLISYLDTEITNHRAERGAWVTDCENWQIDYWAQPAEVQKSFPFKGACNIVIPLTAIAVEAVHAKEMTTLFALNQFVTLKLPEQYDDLRTSTERVLDNVLLKDVDIYKFCNNTLLENKKLGSCVGKTGYEKIVKRAIRTVGDTEQEFDVVTKQGPVADGVPLVRFLMPFTCIDPQIAPWCGEEHLESPYYVKLACESGFFYPEVYDNLLGFISQGQSYNISSASYTQEVRQLQDQQPIQWPKELSWHEIWLSFDVNGDDKEEEIVVHYHQPSQTFFSVRYNYYPDLRRPYRIGNYFPMEYRWAGIGIGKQNEQFQAEITTQHRQRIDNATLANMRMFKVKQGIGYGPNEPVFPGKIWLVEESDDIESVQLAEIYPSSYNNESQANIYSNQRLGVNELTLGMPQVGTPGTATGDLSRVQEANRKFDYVFKNSKRFVLDITGDTILNISQFGVSNPRMYDYIPNGDKVRELLSLPADDLKLVILNDISLAGQNSNKLIDRNTWTQLSGITQNYFQGMIQAAQALGQPQLMPMIAMKAMQAGTEVFKQILESYDVRSIDKITLEQLLYGLQNPQSLIGAGSRAPQTQQPSGMELPSSVSGGPSAEGQ